MTTPIEFGGRVVMVGCGSIGQAILPLLRRHLALAADGLIVLAADEVGRGVSQEHGAQFFYAHLKLVTCDAATCCSTCRSTCRAST